MAVLPIFPADVECDFLTYTARLDSKDVLHLRHLCLRPDGLDHLRVRLVMAFAFNLYTKRRSFSETMGVVSAIRQMKSSS